MGNKVVERNIMSQEEVMEFLGIERKTLYTYRKELGLPCYKVKGKLFFKHEDVVNWMEKFKEQN